MRLQAAGSPGVKEHLATTGGGSGAKFEHSSLLWFSNILQQQILQVNSKPPRRVARFCAACSLAFDSPSSLSPGAAALLLFFM